MNEKRNKEKFQEIWDTVIFPQAQELCSECPGVHMVSERAAKRDCWTAYKAFNKHCSNNYMGNPNAPLDRHKVAACYTYAIVAAHILQIPASAPDELEINLVNERLAITVGCSVLAGYTYQTIKNMQGISDEQREKLLARVREGVHFPDEDSVSHGVYLKDVLSYLGFTYAEQNYNILLLGLLFYEWEKTMLPDQESHRLMMRARPGEYDHIPEI